jgi:hypothetical protein
MVSQRTQPGPNLKNLIVWFHLGCGDNAGQELVIVDEILA